MFNYLKENQPALSVLISSSSVLVLTLSVIAVYFQIKTARRNQKEATARNIFNAYLLEAIKNPVLAYPKRFESLFDYNNKTIRGNELMFEKYEWFVSLVIFSMRELVDILDDDKYWNLTAKRQISYHITYIKWRQSNHSADIDVNDFIALAGDKVNSMITDLIDEQEKSVVKSLE